MTKIAQFQLDIDKLSDNSGGTINMVLIEARKFFKEDEDKTEELLNIILKIVKSKLIKNNTSTVGGTGRHMAVLEIELKQFRITKPV